MSTGQESQLRKRKQTVTTSKQEHDDNAVSESDSPPEVKQKKDGLDTKNWLAGSYWLVRVIFIRCLACIYFVAFLVALNQNKQLIGNNGLLPVHNYLQRIRNALQSHTQSDTVPYYHLLEAAPTLLWWVPEDHLDFALDYMAYIGLTVSAIIVILGAGNVIMFAVLWVLYHSISSVGQRWYSFGWESQLLEMGFLTMFLCPVLSLKQFPRHTPTSLVIVWGNRWMIFRIMIGAGLIKIRGDQCWRDLTCMNYHYETQPVPNPLSYYLHQSPEIIHKIETFGNHIVELIVPFFIFLPQPFCAINGFLQILFQIILVLSGNLSFLNWLTMIPSIFCFDDRMVAWMFPKTSVDTVTEYQRERKEGIDRPRGFYIRKVVSFSLALLLAYLSVPVVKNLLSSQQMMNTSFDSLKILNTYGAFGSVTKQRGEVIIEGTYDMNIGKNGELAHWQELEFNCKPGNVSRRPCIISPYHYRLDWLMWFAGFQTYQHNPWLIHFCAKLLAGDPSLNSLIAYNPFKEKPPKYVRALHYLYKYTKIGSPEATHGQWWKREFTSVYLPIVNKQSLQPLMKQLGWKWYKEKKEKKLNKNN